MRYLITGGAGFIGSHLADQLVSEGHEMIVIDDLSTGSYDNIAHLEGARLRLIVGSILESELVAEYVKEVDAVFHLASAVGVRLIIDEPVKTIETIVGGTDVVLRACARYRKPALITSTSEVYGKGSRVPFNEKDDRVMGPTVQRRWSYATAKAVDEFLGLAHWHESRLPVTIVRLFNTVGPRQSGQYGMVVPRFVRQGLRGEPITVYGDGTQSRCFAHVADVVGALVDLMHCRDARGEIVNIGSTEEISILGLAEKVREITGNNSEIEFVPYEKAYAQGFDDMQRRVPDLTKVQSLIGYQPKNNLELILQDVIAWEKANTGDPGLKVGGKGA